MVVLLLLFAGLSSGGADTLLLSMEAFDTISVEDNKKFANIGVGVVLKRLAFGLRDHGLAMPHGECPLVGKSRERPFWGANANKRFFFLLNEIVL